MTYRTMYFSREKIQQEMAIPFLTSDSIDLDKFMFIAIHTDFSFNTNS